MPDPIIIEPQYPGEEYATIRCGNTEVRVGYTVLAQVLLQIDPGSPWANSLYALTHALDAIRREAAEGSARNFATAILTWPK